MKGKYILAACIICSLIMGFVMIDIYINFIKQDEYSWIVEVWWLIPMCFGLGFIIPLIAYAFMKIGY